MGGLNATLSVATGALEAQEVAIQTTSNNISNANTAGYAREIVNFTQNGSVQMAGVQVGDGVQVSSITSVRDQLLGLRIQQQTSAQSAANAASNILNTIQTNFPNSGAGIGQDLSNFFTSLSALSTSPSSVADRQTVISNAGDLVTAFNSAASALTSTQTGLNSQVTGDVTEINQISSQIATLNAQISQNASSSDGNNALVGQREALEQQLSGIAGVQVTSASDGDTITMENGTPLVVGAKAYNLTTSVGGNGLTQVLDSQGTNITSQLSSGDLGGTLVTRDQTIPSFEQQLDTLAYNLATQFNTAQAQGKDLSGNTGTPLFNVGSDSTDAAATISLATNDGSDLAVSSDGSAGSNGNLANLTGVQYSGLAGAPSPTDLYSGLVNVIGNAVSSATTQSTALQTSLTQLGDQQSSISGVSIDEESSNLIRFQQAYQAAAQVINTINTLFSTTLNMVQPGA